MSQNEERKTKVHENDYTFNASEGEKYQNDNSINTLQPLDLSSLQNQISGKLSNCYNIQFGTHIITSNLNVTGRCGNGVIDSLNQNNNDSCNESLEENIYCQIGCEKLITVTILIVSLIALLMVISFLILQHDYNRKIESENNTPSMVVTNEVLSTSYKDTTLFIHETTQNPNPWLIGYNVWRGVDWPQKCFKNLLPTDTIRFWHDTARCNTWESCTSLLKQEAFLDIDGCHYDDIRFHFAISEQGLVFECRSTHCEIPPEYKDCNQSVLYIRLYVGYTKTLGNEETCRNSPDFLKQTEGLITLLEYSQRKGVLLNKPLNIYVSKQYCGEDIYDELNKVFGVSRMHEAKLIGCNVNTCIE